MPLSARCLGYVQEGGWESEYSSSGCHMLMHPRVRMMAAGSCCAGPQGPSRVVVGSAQASARCTIS